MHKPLEMIADCAEAYARRLGEENGKNAAEWYAQDSFGGRVTRGADESAARILKGIEDGDPEILDSLPRPNLSGEWAGDMTGPELVADAIADAGVDEDRHSRIWAWVSEYCFSDICDAYEMAFDEACQDAVARLSVEARA